MPKAKHAPAMIKVRQKSQARQSYSLTPHAGQQGTRTLNQPSQSLRPFRLFRAMIRVEDRG